MREVRAGVWHWQAPHPERLGAQIYVPPPDDGDPEPVDGQVFRAGDRLPVGVEAFEGMEPNDLVLWVESRRAVVAGDTLIVRDKGLEIPADWVDGSVEQVREGLCPLLEARARDARRADDRAALERALA